ncbi:MAG: hypothetical protein HY663_01795 [Chloroflexi bacterium]|nr:hypothetical protein [Chloroflexota bacterium]
MTQLMLAVKGALIWVIVTFSALLLSVSLATAAGFDEFGYNRTARVFVGTGLSWCQGKFGWTVAACEAYLGDYTYDQIVMKWNKEWDRGNTEDWNTPPYNAWTDNEWNGAAPDGSGSVWHYKIVWVGPCGADYTSLPNGGYCIWGQFEVLMDQGIDPNFGPGHFFLNLANPAGYGAYYSPLVP